MTRGKMVAKSKNGRSVDNLNLDKIVFPKVDHSHNVGIGNNANSFVESDKMVEDALEELRIILHDVKDLYCPLDNGFLVRFLRARKFDVAGAAKLVQRYYEMKRLNKDIATIPIKTYKKIYDSKVQMVLRHRDDLGRKIILIRTGLWNPSVVSMDQLIMSTFFILNEMTASVETQRNGIILILDNAGLTFRTATQMALTHCTIKHFQKMILFFQGSYPARFKAIHSVNTPYIFESTFAVMKYLMKQKLRDRIHLHRSSYSTLHQFLCPAMLPRCLDGELSDEDGEDIHLMQTLYSKEEYYRELSKFGYRE